jgi:hypothetical protein
MKNITLRERLKTYYFIFIGFIPSLFLIFFSLNFIMKITGSVKHKYLEIYKSIFRDIRLKKLNILEIGIGGHDLEYYKGGSLLMWKHYFLFSNIFGLDIINKNYNNFPRIKSFKGSQVDEFALNNVLVKMVKVDIIIDDGSHFLEHILFSFKYLFKHLSDGGIYIIEDIRMPYLKSVTDTSLEKITEPIQFFNTLIHRINSSNFGEIIDDYYINNINNVVCNDSQIIIYKGKRNSRKVVNKFTSDKMDDGYIKIFEKLNDKQK